MSQGDRRNQFGPQRPFPRDAKQHYDPGGTLTPGYEVF